MTGKNCQSSIFSVSYTHLDVYKRQGEEKERELAVRLALEKLKAGGNLYCSFIMNFAGIIFDMKNGPGCLEGDIKNEFFGKVLDSIVTGTEYALSLIHI